MNKVILIFLLLSISIVSCEDSYSPKPRGYFRINFPEKKYLIYDAECPFSFKYPAYSTIEKDMQPDAKPCWFDINIKPLNGKIHISYFNIDDKKMFAQLTEDARTLAYKHTVKAEEIKQAIINRPEEKVYGVYYKIEGNTASQIQFFITDSVKNYLRGSLYFSSKPQIDSLRPVLDFVKSDIDIMLESLKWKN